MLNVNSPQRVGNPYAFLDRNRTRDMVFYGRVSTEHEAQLSALENQIQWYDDQAKYHPNWNVLNKYIDATVIIGLKQNPTHGRRFSPIFLLYWAFCEAKRKMLL